METGMLKPLPTAKKRSAPKLALSAIKCAKSTVGMSGLRRRISPSMAIVSFSVNNWLTSPIDRLSVSERVIKVDRVNQGNVTTCTGRCGFESGEYPGDRLQ